MLQAARKHVVVEAPNDVWTVDFKGWWTTRDGRRCEPLTVRDAFSRFILALRILPRSDTDGVRAVFEELFERHGLPKVIQSDNGAPFAAGRSLAGLTKLSAWWISLGIDVVRSRPGCPQDNGAHERMHADISVELQTQAAQSIRAQQRACDDWRVEFNHMRPHEALGLETPADVYRSSPRRLMRARIGGFPDDVEIVKLGAVRQVLARRTASRVRLDVARRNAGRACSEWPTASSACGSTNCSLVSFASALASAAMCRSSRLPRRRQMPEGVTRRVPLRVTQRRRRRPQCHLLARLLGPTVRANPRLRVTLQMALRLESRHRRKRRIRNRLRNRSPETAPRRCSWRARWPQSAT